VETTAQKFLGTGWSFPPEFVKNSKNSVVLVSGEADVRQSLWLILSTTLGERIMLPQFGSQIWEMVFQGIDTTLLTQLQEMVRQAILEWEPRVDVASVDVQPSATLEGVVTIAVDYVIRKTNSRSNLVYPFYISEGTIPPQAP
jgi:phage baseplate assembly protein W